MENFVFGIQTLEGFTPIASAVGGGLIGLAAIGLLLFNGRIAGISGIMGGVLHPVPHDTLWRAVFLAGLLSGALLISWFHPAAMAVRVDAAMPVVVLGGLLVGFGTRLGGGCTSGHGVCGVGRLAPRSLVASAIFFTCAVATVYVTRHVLGGL